MILVSRFVYLTIINRSFLLKQGNARVLRNVVLRANRGVIVDRNGSLLAINISVGSVWINPKLFAPSVSTLNKLAGLLQLSTDKIKAVANNNAGKAFVYLKRNLPIEMTKQIKQLKVKGLYIQSTYRRYYPMASSASHLLGFTNIDNQGQEGLELAYNQQLQGKKGTEAVIKDRLGHIVNIVKVNQPAIHGDSLTLTIDHRIQSFAYQVLAQTVKKFKAQSGSAIVLDPTNGEVLAMVNQPAYDPNQRKHTKASNYRNRAVTDVFEPGSTMKVFTIAAALASGQYQPDSKIDTGFGVYRIGSHLIHDDSANHVITVTQILKRSSNIGAAKLALSLGPDKLLQMLKKMGFGRLTHSHFPGERRGFVPYHRKHWPRIDLATLGFGYGLTVTPLQLAHAYAIIANHGIDCPISLVKADKPPICKQVIAKTLAQQMINMLHAVVEQGGTGTYAKIPYYHIGGKTGTAYIAASNRGGYGRHHHQYMSSFVGFAPLAQAKLLVAVVIDRPHGQHFGALVAAPAFAKIMAASLQRLDIAPAKVTEAK